MLLCSCINYRDIDMSDENQPIKYPDALSRNLTEGGYTFLHRVFRKNIDSGKPVIINTGNMYFQYQYLPGQTTFEQGVSLIEGDPNDETKGLFMSVVRKFG